MSQPLQARQPADRRASIAVDLGAESCRVSLLRWTADTPEMRLVHRFPNGPVRAGDGSLRWPLQAIIDGVEHGIRLCADLAPEGIGSLAVDGWAVDYVRLDEQGSAVEDPFCYRDERNRHAADALHQHISAEHMREITGIEQQPLNTLYQLYADQLSGRPATRWLNLPEYLLFRWGAEPVAEHTNASHTQMVDLFAGNWSREIFRAAELDLALAPRIVPPGTLLGKLSGPLASLPALADTDLIVPACHDTASAIAGIAMPSVDKPGDDWAYISCGTWSLVGTLVSQPLNSPSVRQDNFTNLGAVGGATCFHKGINGMWILKQCMDHWSGDGEPWDIVALLRAAELEDTPVDLLHIDDPALLGMGDMPGHINMQRQAKGLSALSEHSQDAPRMVCLLLHSLAARYAEVIDRIRVHSDKTLRRIVMVGGGSQNAMLRRLTAERTGLEVLTGPSESSTIGNFAVQRAVLEGHFPTTSPEFAVEVAAFAASLGSGALVSN